MKKLLFYICALILFSLPAASQQDNCTAPAMATAVAPKTGNTPVEVAFGFIFNDITEISDPDQNIEVDIAQIMEWTDPRLADKVGCYLPYSSVWAPRAELINSSKLSPKYTLSRNQIEVLEGGRVRYLQRYSGTISTYHELSRFPFDKQVFEFRIVSPHDDADHLRFVPIDKDIRVSERLNIEDWSFGKIKATASDETLPSFERPHSVITITLEANRHVWFYLFKMMIPLQLIVAMSWVLFWIPPEKFEAQLGFAATSMLTLIAFQFGLVNSVPKLNYFTSMDYLVFGSTVIVFSAMAVALVTAVLFRNGYEKRADDIEHISRWMFPAVTAVYWVIIIMRSSVS